MWGKGSALARGSADLAENPACSQAAACQGRSRLVPSARGTIPLSPCLPARLGCLSYILSWQHATPAPNEQPLACYPSTMEPGQIWPLSVLLRTKDQFALFFVSSFAAKLLHLYSHRASLPILLIVLYTPTFFLPDVLLVLFNKLVVYRQNRSRAWRIFGGLLA